MNVVKVKIPSKISKTLHKMNWNFGKGNVSHFLSFDGNEGSLVIFIPLSPNGGYFENKKFTFKDGYVTFLGRRRSLEWGMI